MKADEAAICARPCMLGRAIATEETGPVEKYSAAPEGGPGEG